MTSTPEKLEDLLARVPPKMKRNGKRKSSIPPALRRRLVELLKDALAPVVPYSGDIETMRKAAEESTRDKIQEALKLLGE